MHTILLSVLLLLSGCAALVYEIVWFHLLRLIVGSSSVSLAILLSCFMGGMALGSALFSRVVSTRRNPLKVLALLEVGVAASGFVLLWLSPVIGRSGLALGASAQLDLLVRGLVAALCLIPPTLLMGATLPAAARWLTRERDLAAKVGFVYGANIAGAVLGSAVAGLLLLRLYDVVVATLFAMSLNVVVGLVAFLLARRPVEQQEPAPQPRAEGGRAVYVVSGVVALSGFCALGAEVVWTRLLSLLFGVTVYAISIILAVFLAGLSLGSLLGSALAKRFPRPRLLLGITQLLVAVLIVYSALMITGVIPFFWTSGAGTAQGSTGALLGLDFLRCAIALLPTAVLWGASFPLALACVAEPGRDPGREVGGLYAANTVGAVVGSLLFSLLLIPGLGTLGAQRVLVVVAALAGGLALMGPASPGRGIMAGRRRWLFGVPVLAAALFALAVPATPAGLVADGRVSKAWDEATQYSRFVAEGRNASVAVTTVPSGLTALHISGKVVASTAARDMRIQRILGHLPAFLHRAPRNALVVGLGAGVTAGSLTLHESIERVVVVELEEAVRIAAGRFFAVANNNVVNSYKAEILIDDARHYMASGEEKFDVITSDPIHPWVKGAAALFSREYYLACRHRLRPGGVIAQWLPLYELDERSVRMALATFFSVFPNGSLWTNEVGSDQDLVMVGWHSDPVVDVQRLRAAMITPPLVRASMAEVGYGTATQLLRAYVGSLPGVEPWLRGAELNADYSLKLEYAAGLSMHQGTRHGIGKRLATRSYPEHLLANVPPWMELNLRRAFGDTDIVASETLAAREVLVSYQGAVPVGPPVQRTRDEALARASELAAQLREAPDSFEQVAKSASDATASASQGGRLPTWKTGAMPAAIELAVQRLAVGEIGAPVESEFGFHVLMREALSEQPEEVGAGIRLERVGP